MLENQKRGEMMYLIWYYGVLNEEIQGTWKINVWWKNRYNSTLPEPHPSFSAVMAWWGEKGQEVSIYQPYQSGWSEYSVHCCWIIHWGEEENLLAPWNSRRQIVLLPSLRFLNMILLISAAECWIIFSFAVALTLCKEKKSKQNIMG